MSKEATCLLVLIVRGPRKKFAQTNSGHNTTWKALPSCFKLFVGD